MSRTAPSALPSRRRPPGWRDGASSRCRSRGWSREDLSENRDAPLEILTGDGEGRDDAKHGGTGRQDQEVTFSRRGDNRRGDLVELESPHQPAPTGPAHGRTARPDPPQPIAAARALRPRGAGG